LEAPVSGSKGPAHAGALIFLCAGDEALFNEIKDSGLAAMGKASHFFQTQVGYGTRAKLVVNSLMGAMIGQGAIQCPMFDLKGPKMIVKDHAPNFPLKHAHKDMDLACTMAKAAGVEYSVIGQAERIFRDAREDPELNVADEDFSAVYEKIHKESTSEASKNR
jgi:3-hydroxyisobutyrate dehydrogenase-like beta-hydroxyacid dehydrogenase